MLYGRYGNEDQLRMTWRKNNSPKVPISSTNHQAPPDGIFILYKSAFYSPQFENWKWRGETLRFSARICRLD